MVRTPFTSSVCVYARSGLDHFLSLRGEHRILIAWSSCFAPSWRAHEHDTSDPLYHLSEDRHVARLISMLSSSCGTSLLTLGVIYRNLTVR